MTRFTRLLERFAHSLAVCFCVFLWIFYQHFVCLCLVILSNLSPLLPMPQQHCRSPLKPFISLHQINYEWLSSELLLLGRIFQVSSLEPGPTLLFIYIKNTKKHDKLRNYVVTSMLYSGSSGSLVTKAQTRGSIISASLVYASRQGPRDYLLTIHC